MRGKGGEGGERTYGIWGFVAFFTLLAVVGLVMLLMGVGSGGGTTQVPVNQTLPDRATSSTTSVAPDSQGATTTTATNGTGDVALPDGATQVLSEGGTTSYAFRPPAGSDTTGLEAAVAPTTVRVGADDRTVTLTIGCARSAEEFLAQVVVTEGDRSVTIAAIAAVPPDAPACPADASSRQVEIELPEAIAGRVIAVVPAGTAVPAIEAN